MAFELLGWDNPLERYPAPVIPIGRLNGQLVAVYPGGHKKEDPIPEEAVFTHFTISEERTFFSKLLADPSFCQEFPEMRTTLQRVASGE
jgi:hypothetical protein